jgi:raffinose/stachyose/melibiose transport system permease protein
MKTIFRNNTAVAVFALPALLTVGVMVFFPLAQVFWYGFFDWDGLSTPEFIRLGNYARIIEDPLFWRSFLNGFRIIALVVVYQLGLGTLLAVSLTSNRRVFGRGFLRRSFFVPVVLSVTVVSQLWLSVYNAEFGLLNTLLSRLGLSYRQEWLSDTGAAIWAIGFTNAWHYLGIHFILIYAGIKSIPEHYFESARIDGAGSWTRFWRITLPLLAETYRFSLIFAVTGGLRVFAESYIMTEGGPGTASYTLTFLVYRSAFRVNEYGYGNAVAVILVLEALLFTVLIMRFVARERVTH